MTGHERAWPLQSAYPVARSAERSPVSPPGRPKGEYRSAQHEGTPVSGHRSDRLPAMAAALAHAGAPLKVGSGNERARRVTARRAVMLCLLRAGAGLVAGSPWQSRAQGGVGTQRTEDSDGGLARLEAVLEK